MAINTIIGQVATGNNFFPRDNIIKNIWEKINSGSNILLVAPRRVGKTSILYHLVDNPHNAHIVIYFTSESINNENEFYRKLYHHISDALAVIDKYKTKIQTIAKDLLSRIEAIGKDGITIGESKITYYDVLKDLLLKNDFESTKIVVLVDEFSQTVENIIQDEGERAAIHFLESKREIRQLKGAQSKIQFVYAGSIGLENIVSKINSINTINDLSSVSVTPLTKEESKQFIRKILDDSQVRIPTDAFDYLTEKVEWLIPFYFQLILDESYKILTEEKSLTMTKITIDKAIENSLKHRIYFEQWFTRLRKAYKAEEFSFVKELLNSISENSNIKSSEIIDLASKYNLRDSYTDLLNALKHDGYINNNDDPKVYRFNSPLLKEWWYRNVAN